MRIPRQVLVWLSVAFTAVGCYSNCLTSAFVPSSRRPSPTSVTFLVDPISTRSHTSLALPCLQDRRCRLLTRRWAAADDDDDEDDDDDDEYEEEDHLEPLSEGVNSVSWLPTVIGARGDGVPSSVGGGAEILPLFPLGGIVYTPNSEHVLNIFEPRYREMYSDILLNGSKRFVVSMSHPTEQGRFAQTGVLFELQELKEVSEQTGDRIKYICNHKVTGRVHITKVLNPEAWQERDTYLRVEGIITDDSGKKTEGSKAEASDAATGDASSKDVYGAVAEAASTGNPKEEKALRDAFSDLVDMQHSIDEDVRFTRASVASMALKDGPGDDGLWQTIKLWQSFAEQRLMARQNELQKDFQERLQEYLKKEKGLSDKELPSAIGFQELSPGLRDEVKELQKRMAVELQPLVLESTLTMQKLLEANGHTDRLKLQRYFIEAETKRLRGKKTLKGMFSGESGGKGKEPDAASNIPPEEQLSEEDDTRTSGGSSDASSPSSFFTDEPDAFQ